MAGLAGFLPVRSDVAAHSGFGTMWAAMGGMRAARRAKPLIQHGCALRRALYRLTHVWSGLGAKGGTRTRTGVTRQNLNLVRLPIPPLSLVRRHCIRLQFPQQKTPGVGRALQVWWAVKDSNRATVARDRRDARRAAARPHLRVQDIKNARTSRAHWIWWAVKDSNLRPID